MINIAEIIPGPDDATSFYRGKLPNIRLQKSNPDILFTPYYEPKNTQWNHLLKFDIAFLQRPSTLVHLNFIIMCKNLGIKVWVDYDDNLLQLNPENPAYPVYDHPRVKFNVKRILELADAVTVSTGFLAKEFESLNGNITVIPNAVDLEIMKETPKEGRHRFVTWRGGSAHIKDLFEFSDEIARAGEINKEWIFNFIGYNPFNLTEKLRSNFYAWNRDVIGYLDTLSSLSSKVMIVPLSDNKFNRSKSNCAWMEGTYAGSAVLAPDWEEWKQPGIVNYSDNKDFEEKLKALLSGEVDIQKCVQLSWGYIKRNLSLLETNKLRYSVIRRLLKQECHQHLPEEQKHLHQEM